MEVVASKPSGDVDDFSDEVEARDFFSLHGFGVEFGGVDTPGGHFGFGVAFGACGGDAPGMELLLEFIERGISPVGGWMEVEPALGHSGGQDGSQSLNCCAGVATGVAGE